MSDRLRREALRLGKRLLLFSLVFWLLLGSGVYLFMYGPDPYVYRDGDWGGFPVLVAWAYTGAVLLECLLLGWARFRGKPLSRARVTRRDGRPFRLR
jgi:hypothetical protein